MSVLEHVRAYLDDLLIPNKGSFEDHQEKIVVVLVKLFQAGLWTMQRKVISV